MKRRDFIKGAVVGGSLLGTGIFTNAADASAETFSKDKKRSLLKKSLILYSSRTNNTTKVVERFKTTLERSGWECDVVKIEQNSDPMSVPFNYKEYGLICAGSGVRMHAPYAELLHVLRVPIYGFDPRIMLKMTEGIQPTEAERKLMQEAMKKNAGRQHGRIYVDPNAPKAFSFVTYAGHDLGPTEAQPALDWINLELAHLEVEIVGKFCCPGRFEPNDNPAVYHTDLSSRPNERDLLRAELFIEEVLEAITPRPS